MSDHQIGLQGREFPYHVDTTADHWWPKGLQRLWANREGYISRVKPSGEVERRKPPKTGSKKGFAQKRGGHRVSFGISPWNHTFEPDFDEIDNDGPPLLRRLAKHVEGEDQGLFDASSEGRTTATIVKLCFSLMIRSPAFRHHYSHAGEAFGLGYNEETGKANVAQFWRFAKGIKLESCNAGSLCLLHSDDAEFCFGDGLCDTIFTRAESWRLQGKEWIADLTGDALIPLLPNLCAHIFFIGGGCGTKVRLQSVGSDMVSAINELTQIYSKEQLFYRAMEPSLSCYFERNEHMAISPRKGTVLNHLRSMP